ncbi:MAG: iron-containing alcohol dehydrogenase [Actinobacteria bacterium]|nr:iron-containing alcohol dehydrogenase [Actinomycetota bacterium]
MKDFEFCIPTKIVFGKDRIREIGAFAKKYGKKLLLVYGQSSIKKNGVYDKVVKSLDAAGLKYTEFSGVKSNPVLSHVNKGIEIAKKENVDFVLAVGGGSAIDEAKAIASGLCYDGNVWDFYNGKKTIEETLPILTIPTLPAAASEMNGGSVITNEQTRQKFGIIDDHLFPAVSILDPLVTFSVPLDYTAYGAVDAISHLTEGYFTHDDNWVPIQDRYVEGLVRTIIESTDIVLKNPHDYDGRSTLMWAASLAWNGMSVAGVSGAAVPNHMFAHVLGAFYDIAHGAALSIIIPAWMQYVYKNNLERFAGFAKEVFKISGGQLQDDALEGIERLKGWFKKIGAPVSFKDAGIPENEIDQLSKSALELAGLWKIKGYTIETIRDIYKLCAK